VDIPSTDGNGLSHWTLFNPGTPSDQKVPEGGATAVLLGGGLVGLALLRRRMA
jgi:hypothetical protein